MLTLAKFDVSGLDDIGGLFMRHDAAVQAAIPVMLNAGADVLVEGQRQQALSMLTSDRSTGDLANSIKKDKVKSTDTGQSIEVYPHGKDRHNVRNATKAFVHEYGRSNMPARPFMTAANEKYADEATAAMHSAWEGQFNE